MEMIYLKDYLATFLIFAAVTSIINCCDPCNRDDKWDEWSTWSVCNRPTLCHTGQIKRESTYKNIFACVSCSIRYEQQPCGLENNNCEQECNPNDGSCSCNISGYQLNPDKKSCSLRQCVPIVLNSCQETFSDNFGSICQQAISNCPQVLSEGSSCTFFCSNPSKYLLKKIIGLPFGENVTNAINSATCTFVSGVMKWNNQETSNYYCRRSNDPPRNLSLSSDILLEHAPVGTIIGTLSAIDEATQILSYSLNPQIDQFYIENNKLKNMKVFRLANTNNSIYLVNIRVSDNLGMYMEHVFTIKIINVNDPPTDIKIVQNTFNTFTPINSVVGVLLAIDPDVLNPTYTSDFNWSLLGNQSNFYLNGSNLILKKKIYNINKDFVITIRIRCGDKDTNEMFLEKDVSLYFSNSNDHPVNISLNLLPLFENRSVNEVVGKVSAIDLEGQEIRFDITSTNQTFGISDVNCTLKKENMVCETDFILLKPLDYETMSQVLVTITATDAHGESSFNQFQLNVLNVNEPPYGIIVFDAYISENSAPETKSACIEVHDPDFQSKVTCSLDTENSFFVMNAMCIYVKNGALIDYEENKHFTLKIVCTDDGQPPLSVSSNITIEVKDVNEAPTKICLTNTLISPNLHSYGSELSQILIEDPDIIETKEICLLKDQAFKLFTNIYNCSIYYDRTLPYDLIVGNNLTIQSDSVIEKFNVDKVFKFVIKCWENLVPSNSIETSDVFTIQGIPCPSPFVQAGAGCQCPKGLTGLNCDRNESLCLNGQCSLNEICSIFIKAKTRCVSKEFVLPVLLNTDFKTYYSGNFRFEMEIFVTETLHGNMTSYPVLSRKRRNVDVFLVESSSEQPIGSSYMFVKVILMDQEYNLVNNVQPCKILSTNQKLHCLNEADCEIMKKYGFPCAPSISAEMLLTNSQSNNSKTQSWVIWLIVVTVLVGILGVVVFVYRTKYQKISSKIPVVFYNNFEDTENSCGNVTIDNESSCLDGEKPKNNFPKINQDNFYETDQKVEHIYASIDNIPKAANLYDTRNGSLNKACQNYVNLSSCDSNQYDKLFGQDTVKMLL